MPEQNIDYHKHIEQAIQNVLSKVKKIPLPSTEEKEISTLETKTLSESAVQLSSEPPVSLPPTVHQETISEVIQVQEEIPVQPVVYLEADDLYTPIPLEELKPPEPEEEAPLIADNYVAPYNIFEEFVETELNIMLSRYIDLCRCSQCRADIVALALHQLPAYYVTGTRGTLTAKSVIWTKYMQQIIDAVSKAIHIVYKRPRSNCKKIKQMIWIKPEIEDITLKEQSIENSRPCELFEQIHTDNIELTFSSEVEEIIQIIEQGDSYDKASLLPVSSPYVHKAYQTNSDSSTVTDLSEPPIQRMIEQNPQENPAALEPTMELIEDWD